MTVRAIDQVTGDIITSGQQFISGVDEIAQTIATRLRLFLGEYFRDITDGTPWFQEILGKTGTLANKEALLKRRILQTNGVTGLATFTMDFDIDSRELTVTSEVLTIYGTVQINEGVPV